MTVCGWRVLSGTETWPGMMGTDDISRPNNQTEDSMTQMMNPCSVSGQYAGELTLCRRIRLIYGFASTLD